MNFAEINQKLRVLFLVLVIIGLAGCHVGHIPGPEVDKRLDCKIGQILTVKIHYGEALNAKDGGWYSVEIKNPKNPEWSDIIIWTTPSSRENTKDEFRNYEFTFYAENFRTQWQNEPSKEIDAKPKYAGPYEVYIRNSFGYEKKYYTEVKFSIINTLNLEACDIVFEPGYMEIEVP